MSLPGDDNTLYLMDKSLSLFPIEEEFRFRYSKNGIQSRFLSRKSENFYENYRIKIWMPLFSKIVFEYNLEKEDDYEARKEEHLFKLRWVPEERNQNPLSFLLFLSPESSQNKKYIGAGLGYWKNNKNNHFLNLILHEFDYNSPEIFEETSGLKSSFTRYPISFELKGCLHNTQGDLIYRYYKTLPGRKTFSENNEEIGQGEYERMGLKNIMFYRVFPEISPGLSLKYSRFDTTYIPLVQDSIDYKAKTENLLTEPFIESKIFEKSTVRIGFPINWKYIKNDSLEYERKWFGLTFLYSHTLSDYIDFTLGFQKSWRNLNGEKNTETRGILGMNFRFNQKTCIFIRQGLELDFPLPDKLGKYNNHTYLMFSHCF